MDVRVAPRNRESTSSKSLAGLVAHREQGGLHCRIEAVGASTPEHDLSGLQPSWIAAAPLEIAVPG